VINHKLSGYFRSDGQLQKIVCGAIQDFINTHSEVTKENKGSLARRIVAQIKGWVLYTDKAEKAQEFCCYHVTTKDRLPSMLKNGILPNSAPSWFTCKTPYIMLSLYPYWSLYKNREAWGLPDVNEDNVILVEIKHPDIKREYFDDPEGLRWDKVISPNYFNAIIEFKVIRHGVDIV
jgi:hypothetical protein